MTDPLDIVTLAVSLAAVALSLRKHGASRSQARRGATDALGQKYARLAVDAGEQQKHATGEIPSGAMRLATALDYFRIFDTALDGRRDFNDAKARAFIEAEVASRNK